MAARLCLLLAGCVCARAATLTVKGYYCQDPDTGLLYGVNTTWPSKSFCGNYTCRIRFKDHDSVPAGSRTIINITRPNPKEKHKEAPKSAETNNLKYKDNNLLYHINSAHDANFKSIVQNSADDRYLNGEEIQKISELLHTVKKSDLEAIIEIYNLAQEIYKEMDDNPSDAATEPSPTERDLNNYGFEKMKSLNLGHTSYWYEPLNDSGFRKPADLKPEGSDLKLTSTRAYDTTVYTPTPQPTQAVFFRGAVTKSPDLNKLAYYYPMSNFQRLASYYHQRPMYDAHSPHVRAPCNPCTMQQYPPVYGRRPYYPPQKPSSPSMLLPFPFSYQPYNISAYGYNNYNYYKGNPWAYYDYYRTNPYQILSAGHVQKKSVLVNADMGEPQSQEGEKKAVENSDAISITEKPSSDTKPWQTESLTEADLADVRANIAERAKLLKIPLKKRIKLERVAKVIKLDHLNRQRRGADMVVESMKDDTKKEAVELYIEKTMCTSSTEPGYFRVGNMSQPFPDCCPQRIEGSN